MQVQVQAQAQAVVGDATTGRAGHAGRQRRKQGPAGATRAAGGSGGSLQAGVLVSLHIDHSPAPQHCLDAGWVLSFHCRGPGRGAAAGRVGGRAAEWVGGWTGRQEGRRAGGHMSAKQRQLRGALVRAVHCCADACLGTKQHSSCREGLGAHTYGVLSMQQRLGSLE